MAQQVSPTIRPGSNFYDFKEPPLDQCLIDMLPLVPAGAVAGAFFIGLSVATVGGALLTALGIGALTTAAISTPYFVEYFKTPAKERKVSKLIPQWLKWAVKKVQPYAPGFIPSEKDSIRQGAAKVVKSVAAVCTTIALPAYFLVGVPALFLMVPPLLGVPLLLSLPAK